MYAFGLKARSGIGPFLAAVEAVAVERSGWDIFSLGLEVSFARVIQRQAAFMRVQQKQVDTRGQGRPDSKETSIFA